MGSIRYFPRFFGKGVSVFVLLLAGVGISVIALFSRQIVNKHAQEAIVQSTPFKFPPSVYAPSAHEIRVYDEVTGRIQILPYPEGDKLVYRGDRVLVKLSPDTSKTVTSRLRSLSGPTNQTGVAALDTLLTDIGTTRIESLSLLAEKAGTQLTSSKPRRTDQWYRVSFLGPTNIELPQNPNATSPYVLDNEGAVVLEKKIQELQKGSALIERVEKDYVAIAMREPNDPIYPKHELLNRFPSLWGLYKINMKSAWDTSIASDLRVAVVDTGVDYQHEDIAANIARKTDGSIIGYDFYNGDSDPIDDNGHGTHVAGTIAAVGNNGIGIPGINWSGKIMPVKIFSSSGQGTFSDAITGLVFAMNNGARVINNSWGCSSCPFDWAMHDAFLDIADADIVNVVAAGNNNADALVNSPANDPNAITVGASAIDPSSPNPDTPQVKLWYNSVRGTGSAWGPKIDVVAPGADILSLKAHNTALVGCPDASIAGYIYCTGTSMAAPHVAGVAVLMLAKRNSLTAEQVRQLLRVGSTNENLTVGYGHLSASKIFTLPDPPYVQLAGYVLPGETAINSSFTEAHGTVSFYGKAAPDIDSPHEFSHWTLSYTVPSGGVAGPWQPIAGGDVAIDGRLGNLDTANLPEKPFWAKLTVTGDTNTYESTIFNINVNNIFGTLEKPDAAEESGESVTVKGTDYTLDSSLFGGYTIEYGEGVNPSSWTSLDVSLVNNGAREQRSPAVLGSINKRNIPEGIHSIRLTIRSNRGQADYAYQHFRVDRTITAGWPKRFDDVVVVSNSTNFSPVVADVNGDGEAEVIFVTVPRHQPPSTQSLGNTNQNVVMVNVFSKNGTPLAGYPKAVYFPQSSAGCILFNADTTNCIYLRGFAIADMNGDGKNDLVLAASSYLATYLAVYDFNGGILPGFPKDVGFLYSGPPTVSDLDGNGSPEILLMGGVRVNGENKVRIVALKSDGDLFWQKEYGKSGAGISSADPLIVVADDIDGDGKKEIIKSLPFFIGTKTADVLVLKYDGSNYPGWPKTFRSSDFFIPAYAADVEKGGAKELVLFEQTGGRSVYANVVRVDTGQSLSGFPYGPFDPRISFRWYRPTPIAIGDGDSDGNADIYFIENARYITILDHTGAKKQYDLQLPPSVGFTPHYSQLGLFADTSSHLLAGTRATINQDSILPISVSVMTFVSDHPVWTKMLDDYLYGLEFNQPILYQFSHDTNASVMAFSSYLKPDPANFQLNLETSLVLYKWDTNLQSAPGSSSTWPQLWHDAARTNAVGFVPTPTPTKRPACWADFNGDGSVTVADLQMIAYYWHKPVTEATKKMDINGNNQIDVGDIMLVANELGTVCIINPTFPPPTVSGGPQAALSLVATAPTIRVGEETSVNTLVQGGANLGGYELALSYNPTVVELTSVQQGPFIGSSGRSVSQLPQVSKDIAQNKKTILLQAYSLGDAPPGSLGNGQLLTFTFKGIAPGDAGIGVERAGLIQIDGARQPTAVSPNSGSLVQVVSTNPTPTATPIPPTVTLTPTPSRTPTPMQPTPTPTRIPSPTLTPTPVAQTHTACRVSRSGFRTNYTCVVVAGPGVNGCTMNIDCVTRVATPTPFIPFPTGPVYRNPWCRIFPFLPWCR